MSLHWMKAVCLALVLLWSLSPLHAGGGPGQSSFERAYRIEKRDPELAVQYYRQALSRGLNRELRKAAKWRLFYLYKDLGNYEQAMRLARELGAGKKARGMEHDLVKEVAGKLGVDRSTAELYIDAANLIASTGPKKMTLSFDRLRKSLTSYPNHERLIRLLGRASSRAKNRSELSEAFASCRSTPCRLAEIRILIDSRKSEKARAALYRLSKQSSLEPRYHDKVLYLLARSHRDENAVLAVDYYRLASDYAASPKMALYYRALAAFALYELGYTRPARALLGEGEFQDSFHLHVLALILQVELDKSRSAYEELHSLKSRIQGTKRKGQSHRLMNAALRILQRGVPR